MHIAITGGSGRIGQATIKLALAEGYTIVNMDHADPPHPEEQAGVTFIKTDLTDYAAVEQALQGCEAIIHLGAIPSPGRLPDHIVHNNNVVGSYNVLLAAAKLGIKKVCQASSVNAAGLSYSRQARFDYFPLDEKHPTYNEDPYSLSKWICEMQGDSIARRYEDMTISSLRFSWVVPALPPTLAGNNAGQIKNLWGYTLLEAAARSCIAGIKAEYKGHEVFYIVAPRPSVNIPCRELAQENYPDVPLKPGFGETQAFFDSSKAERLLGWRHDF
jgi:UDP-glucose 4-epimerase